MKIRRGFVTNSSSSSYIIAKKKDATLADIKNSLLKVRDNAKSFLIEQHKWIDLEPDVEESIRKEDYDKAADAFLEYVADIYTVTLMLEHWAIGKLDRMSSGMTVVIHMKILF